MAGIPLPDIVAANVRAEMAKRQLTVTQMAEALGLDRKVTLSRYRGIKSLTLTEVDLLARWLDVDVDVLLGLHERAAVA